MDSITFIILATYSCITTLVVAYLIYIKYAKRLILKGDRSNSLDVSILRSLITDWCCYKVIREISNGGQVTDYIMPMGEDTMIISANLVCITYTYGLLETMVYSGACINPVSKEEFSQAYHETCTDMASFIVKSRQK